MTVLDVTLIAILPLLLVFSAFFSGAETALFSMTHGDRVRLGRSSPGAAATVAALLADQRMLLISILLLNMTVNVTYFVVTSVLIRSVERAAIAIVVSLATLFAIILIGEVMAKLLARSHRIGFCRVFGGLLLALHRLLGPLRHVMEGYVVTPLARVVRPDATQHVVSVEELGSLLELSEREGTINAEEERLLAEVIELGTLRVRDVMTPRIDLGWIEHDDTHEVLVEKVSAAGLLKIPIRRSEQEVIGLLDVKACLLARVQDPDAPLEDFVLVPRYVPETARLDQLLDHFHSTGTHVALCVDEHGGLSGLVEIEDVVEEIIEATQDPADAHVEQVLLVGLGQWRVSGRLGVRSLTQMFLSEGPTVLPEEQRISTIAGLILVRLGRLAEVGDVVSVANVRLEVASLSGRRIDEVLVSLASENPA